MTLRQRLRVYASTQKALGNTVMQELLEEAEKALAEYEGRPNSDPFGFNAQPGN